MKGNSEDKYKMWYENTRPVYEELSKTVENIVKNLLKEKGINFLSVTSRTKKTGSFLEKIERKSYTSPESEISDLAGIRVITFIEADVDKISKIVESTFKVNLPKSLNKAEELGVDKVGYRSIHYVCDLGEARNNLQEYSKYKGLIFEIQIRTVLQHAWAEIEHDRNYKFSGILPKHIQRRLYTLAGVLELVDREFTSLANEIDKYKDEVSEQISAGNLSIEINSTSISDYLLKKIKKSTSFSNEIIKEISFIGIDEAIKELNNFGIKNISDLDRILTSDVLENFQNDKHQGTTIPRTYIGLLRTAMMNEDLDKYFDTSGHKKWSKITGDLKEFLEKKYGKDKVNKVLKRNNIERGDIIVIN